MSKLRLISSLLACLVVAGCKGNSPQAREAATDSANVAAQMQALVPYDIRRLKPTPASLTELFASQMEAAKLDNKTVAVLFSADWCHACRDVEHKLGAQLPENEIGHMRIFELTEEEWEEVGRIDEFNTLRHQWEDDEFTYPMLVVLDEQGAKRENMDEALERLKNAGVAPTFPVWFAEFRQSTPANGQKDQ